MKVGLIALLLMLSSNVFATTKLVLDQALPFYDVKVSSFESGEEDAKDVCQSELNKIVQNLSDQKVAIVQVESCEQKAAVAAILMGLDLYVGRVVLSHNEIIPTREEVEAVLKQYDSNRIEE
jgi:methionine synthase II (cobalamin-independent)